MTAPISSMFICSIFFCQDQVPAAVNSYFPVKTKFLALSFPVNEFPCPQEASMKSSKDGGGYARGTPTLVCALSLHILPHLAKNMDKL